MSVVLTLVQTKQIRINIHKRNNTKTQYTQLKDTVNTSIHIAKTPTHYKTKTYAPPYITKPTQTHLHTLQCPRIHTPTLYKTS